MTRTYVWRGYEQARGPVPLVRYLAPWACGRPGGLSIGPFVDAKAAIAAAEGTSRSTPTSPRRDQALASPARRANRCSAEDSSRKNHQVPDRLLAVALGGPVHAATAASVRAVPASKVVGGEWGHVASMQDPGCSGLGDRLTTTWRLAVGPPDDAPRPKHWGVRGPGGGRPWRASARPPALTRAWGPRCLRLAPLTGRARYATVSPRTRGVPWSGGLFVG
jgi:hypothetical protein